MTQNGTVGLHEASVGEFKEWGKIPQKGRFSLLGGEYQPFLVLEKNRTSLESRIPQHYQLLREPQTLTIPSPLPLWRLPAAAFVHSVPPTPVRIFA